jgi:hypothetical protein
LLTFLTGSFFSTHNNRTEVPERSGGLGACEELAVGLPWQNESAEGGTNSKLLSAEMERSGMKARPNYEMHEKRGRRIYC